MTDSSRRAGFLTGRIIPDVRLELKANVRNSNPPNAQPDTQLNAPPNAQPDTPPNTQLNAPPDESRFGPLTVVSRRAMASDFEVLFNERTEATDSALAALDEIDRMEEILSVFRPTAAAARVNALAAEMDLPIPPELMEALRLSRQIWEKTDGAFDITSGPLWKAWGFSRRNGRFPTDREREEALRLVGMERLRWDETAGTAAFDLSGMEINFGGIGKGIALDRATQILLRDGLNDFLIQGGGSGAVARGGRLGDRIAPDRPCWTVGITHPLDPKRRLAVLRLENMALATSGSARQFFIHRGRRYSHIIDPKSGCPAEGILSVTVLAPDAGEADALSTAFFILGPERTVEYCERHSEIRAALVLEQKESPGFAFLRVNMPDDILTEL